MNKNVIVKLIHECAVLYENNYANRNFMVVYGNDAANTEYVVIKFIRNNYLHLTGIDAYDIEPAQFFDICRKQKIGVGDFKVRKDGTTIHKLEVLPQIMTLMKKGGLVCNCDKSQGIRMYCDKLVGNTRACLGLGMGCCYYYPKTLLKEDIRKRGVNCKRIAIIFSKYAHEKLYNKVEYTHKNIDLDYFLDNSGLNLRGVIIPGIMTSGHEDTTQ